MDTHRIMHQNNKYTCEKCPTFSTDTPANLHQHQRGKHGKGWKAPCRKRYDWPAKMFRHKKKCTSCLVHKEQAEKAAKNTAAKLAKNSK